MTIVMMMRMKSGKCDLNGSLLIKEKVDDDFHRHKTEEEEENHNDDDHDNNDDENLASV